jgi:hypothetical protein
VLVDAPALPSAHQLPAMDRVFVETEGRNDGLHRAAVGHQGHDGGEQLVRLVHPVERAALGSGEGLVAPFTAVAPLFFAVDYDVSLSRSSVGPALSVVAESFVRVHRRLLLLTSDTSKGVSPDPFSFNSFLIHVSVGCNRISESPVFRVFVYLYPVLSDSVAVKRRGRSDRLAGAQSMRS